MVHSLRKADYSKVLLDAGTWEKCTRLTLPYDNLLSAAIIVIISIIIGVGRDSPFHFAKESDEEELELA